MSNTPSKKDVDELVYALRQKGDDSTYALVVAVLAKWGAPATGGESSGDSLRSLIKGMSVSVDVSTSDSDAGHRYFGTVTEVMDYQHDKHGLTLLVQDAEPNFTPHPVVKEHRHWMVDAIEDARTRLENT